MIDVKEAVKIAVDYLQKLDDYLQNSDDSTELKDILLEEVVLSDDDKYWYVTLSFSQPVEVKQPLSVILGQPEYKKEYKRVYKVFQIDSASGQVRSMQIRAA